MAFTRSRAISLVVILLFACDAFCRKVTISDSKERLCKRHAEEEGETSEIEIHSGKVVGRILENIEDGRKYSAFKGIRYGHISTRYMPSTDVPKWTEVYKAYDHGPVCLQRKSKELIGSEDCLFLNVYTPVLDFNFNYKTNPKKAVMVWIHGGMFQKGSGNSEKFGPDFIVAKDVILVTLNYRLAILGFLNLQHPKAPGNVGLKDQNLALKWVKKNIAKFGGDPDNVTIFGQSAGAVSVDLHHMSPMSKGLFKRSIAMSGSAFCHWAFSYKPIDKAERFVSSLVHTKDKSPEKLLWTLYRLGNEKIIKTHISTTIFKRELEFAPSIESASSSGENTFIDQCIDKPIKDQTFFQGDHIMGFTSQEARKENFAFVGNKRLNELSAITFENPIDLKQQYLIKYSNISVYYYRFGYKRNEKEKSKGVGHSGDLAYIFYKSKHYPNFNEDDMKMKNYYTTMFTNFAKYGNPSLRKSDGDADFNGFEWTPSNKNGNYLEIDPWGHLTMRDGRPIRGKPQSVNSYDANACYNYKPTFSEFLGTLLFGRKIK